MNSLKVFCKNTKRFFDPKNMKRRLKSKGKIFPIVSYIGLVLWVAVLLGLLIWAILSALKSNYDFIYNPVGLPKMGWKWENFKYAVESIDVEVLRNGRLQQVTFFELLLNSLLLCCGVPFFALIDVAMCAYVTSRYKHFKLMRVIFAIVVFVNFVPISASLATNLMLMKGLGLYDNIWGIWIWCSGGFGGFFLIYYAAFKTLSWTYAEAAFVDGAGHFRVFWLIMFPMTRGTFGALFITQFIAIWMDYTTNLIYLPTKPTLAYAAWAFQFEAGTLTSIVPVKLAGMILLSIPTLLLFCLFHKKLIGSITVGGLKG